MASHASSNLTVKAALIQAVGSSRGHDIFNIFDAQKDGTLLLDRFRDVEIRAERNQSGSVVVAFSLPTSHVMVSAGRKASRTMLKVEVSPSSANTESFPSPKGEVDREQEDRMCRAIAVVLEKALVDEPVMEVAIGTRLSGKGLRVFLTRIPYMPGGDTTYTLSEKYEIEEVWPGL